MSGAHLFQKGNDPRRNYGGRPKGTVNKSVEQIRKSLKDFIANNIETIQADFEKLNSKDRLNFLERILKHVMPAPMHDLEKLTDDQLDELIKRIKSGHYDN